MLAFLLLVELNCGSCWVHSVSLHWLVDCVFICVCQTKDGKGDVGFPCVRFFCWVYRIYKENFTDFVFGAISR